MAFGLTLVAAVIVSVIIMVSTSLNGLDTGSVRSTPTPVSMLDTSGMMPVVESAPTPEPTPTPTVEAIRIYSYTTDITAEKNWPQLSLSRDTDADGQQYTMQITAQIIPMDIENPVVTWEVDQPDILHIEQMSDNSNGILAWQTGTVAGGVKLTATCNGVSQSCRIYCVP